MSSCVNDSDSIDLSVTDGALSADLIVAGPTGIVPNLVTVDGSGVHGLGGDGWVPLPATLTALGGPAGNISYYSTSIDLTSLISNGQRLKFTQNATVHYFTVVNVTGAQLSLYCVDGSAGALDVSAVTLPYFSVALVPSGQVGVGPLVVDTGNDIETFYWNGTRWTGRSQPVWSSANAAASTRSANTYANMTAAGYSSRQLPFKAFNDLGFKWEFRWTGGISYAASQSAAGVRLTAIPADLAGIGGVQDTTNIFGEILTFTANAEVIQDSAWVALNPSVAVKDMLVVMPQFKSDGTRTVTVSLIDVFSVRGRLYLS